MIEWWRLTTSWGCGAIRVVDGYVTPGGAPIFKKLWGTRIAKLSAIYRAEKLDWGERPFDKETC